ncbi:hypothetical protein B0H13DRAFT_2379565 [Mycena leptocephala]|nr:hypothetical protein B0H13DRAFT_2379565 [Mycena leptocephala]
MHGASVPSSLFSLSHRLHPTPISSPLTFMLGTSKKKQLDPTELDRRERRRRRAREHMAAHRAAMKAMPPEVQRELEERARAARAKYRAQHRLLLSHKERERREAKSRASHTLDEFIRRRRTRQAKADQRRPTRQSDPTEPDELID